MQSNLERPQETHAPTRLPGLDLTRCMAVFLVVAVHFFMCSGFYSWPLTGGRMFTLAAMRWVCFACVPLFLVLSGFLMNRRRPDAAHYTKAGRILFEYLIACAVSGLFRLFILREALTPLGFIKSVIQMTCAPYAWYLNLYFGLFLLAPFLNLAYHGLTSRSQKRLLVATLLVLTALPALVNGMVHIFPDWWVKLYPIGYYFIGCYLAEFKPMPRKRWCALGIAALALGQAAFSRWWAAGDVFSQSVPSDYGALTNVCMTVLIFLLFYQVRLPNRAARLAAVVSECALSIYLLSWMFDTMLYPVLNELVFYAGDKIPHFFLIVPVSFLSSALCALPVRFAWRRLGPRRENA